MATISAGVELSSDSGLRFRVVDELGKGGQGTVFKVKSSDGRELALKWYHEHLCQDTRGRDLKVRLRELVKRGAPSAHFVWPIDTVTDWETGCFGYLMDVIGNQYCSISALLKRRKTATIRKMLMVAYDMAFGFEKLHARGLCYQDISDGNVLIDTENGRVLIIDNDNVQVDGEKCPAIHTLQYAAPEVVNGQSPSSYSDTHSAAVLLFTVLLNHHPFKGKKELELFCPDRNDYCELYVRNPTYIFHPSDHSNRPVPEEHDNAILYGQKIYPPDIMLLFEKAFTFGVSQPQRRIRLTEWQKVILALLERLVVCRICRNHAFLGPDLAATTCWKCGTTLPKDPQLQWHDGRNIRRQVISCDSEIYQFQLDGDSSLHRVLANPALKAVEHPTNPDLIGLRNLTGGVIKVRSPDARMVEIENGRNFSVLPGVSIFVGNKELTIT